MAGGGAGVTSGVKIENGENKNYGFAMAIMCALFFIIGFITVLNDVLIPSLKGLFDLKPWQAIMIQFCFFTAYFVTSYPFGKLISKIGYKKGLMGGLALMSLGLLGFVPSSIVESYGMFLVSLFIVASGLTLLQVAINPYIPALGSAATASARLNLGGAFNSVATFIGPIIGGWIILDACLTDHLAKAEAVRGPYIVLALVGLTIAGLLYFIDLPQIIEEKDEKSGTNTGSAFDYLHLKFGALAIFFYVGAEVAIGSLLILYLSDPVSEGGLGALSEADSSRLLAYYWGSAMIGRFAGSVLLQKIKTHKALQVVTAAAFFLVLGSMFTPMIEKTMSISVIEMGTNCETGVFGIGFKPIVIPVAAFLLVLVGLMNSIMWPSIFPLGIRGLKQHTSEGSGIMVSMVLGGAVIPLLQSGLLEIMSYQYSFVICLVCYAYLFFFAFKGYKAGKIQQEDPMD